MRNSILNILTGLLAASLSLPASATTFELNDDSTRVIGHNLIVYSKHEDTLLDIGRHFDLGYSDIVDANPNLDPWIPGEDKPVVVPTRFILPNEPHKGIVINLAEMRLYYYPKHAKNKPQQVITHPIGIGREGWATPLGKAKIIQKKKDPTWTPPASIHAEHIEKGDPLPKVVPAGPDNPLGAYAMRLSIPGYLLHGTNRPFGVGLRVSHGCIRLYPEDIKHLFGITALNTPVDIIYKPYKAALMNGKMYLEAHKPQNDIDEFEGNNMTPMVAAIIATKEDFLDDESWPFAEHVVREQRGIVRELHHKKVDVVPDLWFLHAGLKKGTHQKMQQAITALKMDDKFWPIRSGAIEELLVGPFESKQAADEAGEALSNVANIPVWTVQLPAEVL